MEDPRSFFENLNPERVDRALPDKVIVAFHIDGPGGGSWQVARRAPTLSPAGGGPKDCEIRCSSADFMHILRGDLDVQQAFESGRLQILGDIGLALRLRRVLRFAA